MLRLSKLTDYAVVVLTRLDDAAEGGVLTDVASPLYTRAAFTSTSPSAPPDAPTAARACPLSTGSGGA